jgi:geranylgeranyl pyrophosphate synthase
MAIFMGNKVAVVAGTTTITTFVSAVSLSREIDAVEITAMTDSVQNLIGGIERPSVTLRSVQRFRCI